MLVPLLNPMPACVHLGVSQATSCGDLEQLLFLLINRADLNYWFIEVDA
jgi:hypothetical protein